ncbi:YMGG-like glycine zipper-containing protein [Propionivibrio sp.]|uniref:YMGG-like glycine zipper-containing protein n=1 Tax=Propionivibrio sp. TaxID=2212460 RepID=UPI0025F6DE80|nr:YMGG-like glycine zipper-containing protein [Propionivibrio sp.]MBK7356085.1 hypothetical protein [Propionivibrio sp.]MBK8400247.1 hypothetical protein [Propionivibrio sp.]MBK8744045.1 hypothetical protein [Propionivibrio sp.]MBK8893050.1 hypothetical protein [Propionivibrio sp.]MBL0207268.1 hypothetical protein [Propionivibrio sp.]
MKTATAWVALSILVLLGGCASTPTGPSVLSLPGTGKSFNDFRRDDMQCRQYASQQVGSLANDPAVRSAVVGTAVGALAGAAVGGRQGAGVGAGAGLLVGSASGSSDSRYASQGSQRQYDNAYIQCMYASGHKVPVPAALADSQTRFPIEPPSGGYYPPPPPDYNLPPPR